MERDQIISDAYYASRGAITRTLRLAKLRDPKIKQEDIKRWKRANFNEEKRPTKYNTWVGKEPKEEYQVDLFQEKKGAPHQLMVVDTFSKRMAHEPLESNQAPDIVEGFKTAFKEMGGNPKSIYSDAEGGIVAKTTKKWLTEKDIVSNITVNHAPLAEAMIKVLKNRVEFVRKHKNVEGLSYEELLDQEAKNYNANHVPKSIGMTPLEASKPENRDEVKMRLELKRRNRNPQPKLVVGDEVRVFRKKDTFDKGYKAQYSDQTYTIQGIVQTPPTNQTKYIINMKGNEKGSLHYKDNKFTRNELQLVK